MLFFVEAAQLLKYPLGKEAYYVWNRSDYRIRHRDRRDDRSNQQVQAPSVHSYPFDTAYRIRTYSYVPYEYFLGAGLSTPLTYVGDSSYVRLIVPFEMLGSDFQSSGTPVFFDRVRYIFKK